MRENRDLALLLATVAAVSVTMDPVNTLGPAYATKLFHRPDTMAGVLIGAFGLGAVVASVFPAGDRDTPFARVGVMVGLLAAGMVGFAVTPRLAIGLGNVPEEVP